MNQTGCLRREERDEHAIGLGFFEPGENGGHVGLALCHPSDDRNLTAMLGELDGKRIRDGTGIGVAIVDRDHPAQAKLVVAEVRDDARLDEVVIRNAVVAFVVVRASISGEIGCEQRRRVCRRYHRETCRTEDRRCLHRRTGA